MTTADIKKANELIGVIETLEDGLNKGSSWVCFQSAWLMEKAFRDALAQEFQERLRVHVNERLNNAKQELAALGVTQN